MALALLALAAAALPADAAPYLRPGLTERLSVASDGSQALDPVETPLGTAWDSAVSADASVVAFSSTATNLVPNDVNGVADIFVRDRRSKKTEIVSIASNGTRAAGACLNGGVGSSTPSISANGRYVAFTSCATNLVPNDLNLARDGFVHDRLKKTTEIVTVSSEGKQGTMPVTNHDSFASSISPDGRFVGISSSASDLVPGDTNGFQDAFLFDRVTRKIQRVSVTTKEEQTSVRALQGHSSAASVSANGLFVLFNSNADNLVDGDDNARGDLFVRDIVKGTTEHVSVRTGGAQTGGAGVISAGGRAISADGRYVLMNSSMSDLVPNDTGDFDTFVHDRVTRRTERISVGSDGHEGDGSSNSGSLSLDGRYVAFSSQANNLGQGDSGFNGSDTTTVGPQPGDWDVFVYDRKFGSLEMVSRAPSGEQALGHCKIANAPLAALSTGASESVGGSISLNGLSVAYQSCAANLVAGDTNGSRDHFLRDRGPHLGVRGVTAVSGSSVAITGLATFSGAVLATVMDPSADGAAGSEASGAELVKAELLYRPELEDLFLRMDLTQMPSAGVSLSGLSAPGDPRVLYSLRFAANGQNYEVRVNRAGLNPANPLDASYGLFTCTELTCTQAAPLKGGYGTTGEQIVVSIPLSVLTKDGKAITEGGTLTGLRAFTSYGTYFGGEATLLDQLLLSKAPSVPLPTRSVTATIGRTSVRASLVNGKFTAALPRSAFGPSGRATVTFKTCLGTECQVDRVPLKV